MAAKRHHSSKKQSRLSRYHEHSGMERELHGYHPRKSYDTLRHERDMFNDEYRHESMPEKSGPYHYDRETMEKHRLMEKGYPIMRGHYEGAEPRRRQEMRDAGMIHEDPRQIANLPQEVRIEPYPMVGPWTPEEIDDTQRGVDRQIDYDDSQKMRHFFPKKV